jgi:hypothetical protein
MVQLKILSGKKAGETWVTRRFPVHLGRAAGADLQLEEEGVWDQHLSIEFRPREGLFLKPAANALVAVNTLPTEEVLLRNGDLIELGSVKLQFWLSETCQTGLGARETLTWAGVAAVFLAQVGLLYWLLS